MDIELYYREAGSGMPLVLLHGNGESGEYFRPQVEYFSASYRVIVVDTRGHGKSPRGEAPFTLAQFAEDLKAFLDRLGITRCILLGFSDGANIALLFALRYPGYLEKLILNGADLSPTGVKPVYQIPIVLGYATVSLIALFDRKAVAKKELLALMVNKPNIRQSELSALTVPTLVIVGDRDMIKDKHSRLIASSLPDATFVSIPGNHFIAAKASKQFNREVERFLRGLTAESVTKTTESKEKT